MAIGGILILLQKDLGPCGLGVSRIQNVETDTRQFRGTQHCCEGDREVWGLEFQKNPAGALQFLEITGPSQTP